MCAQVQMGRIWMVLNCRPVRLTVFTSEAGPWRLPGRWSQERTTEVKSKGYWPFHCDPGAEHSLLATRSCRGRSFRWSRAQECYSTGGRKDSQSLGGDGRSLPQHTWLCLECLFLLLCLANSSPTAIGPDQLFFLQDLHPLFSHWVHLSSLASLKSMCQALFSELAL